METHLARTSFLATRSLLIIELTLKDRFLAIFEAISIALQGFSYSSQGCDEPVLVEIML